MRRKEGSQNMCSCSVTGKREVHPDFFPCGGRTSRSLVHPLFCMLLFNTLTLLVSSQPVRLKTVGRTSRLSHDREDASSRVESPSPVLTLALSAHVPLIFASRTAGSQ